MFITHTIVVRREKKKLWTTKTNRKKKDLNYIFTKGQRSEWEKNASFYCAHIRAVAKKSSWIERRKNKLKKNEQENIISVKCGKKRVFLVSVPSASNKQNTRKRNFFSVYCMFFRGIFFSCCLPFCQCLSKIKVDTFFIKLRHTYDFFCLHEFAIDSKALRELS